MTTTDLIETCKACCRTDVQRRMF